MSNGSSLVNRLGWKQTNARPSVCLLSQTHIWLVFAAPLLCFLSASCPKGEARRCCITSSRLQEERSSVWTAHHRLFVKCFLTLLSLGSFCFVFFYTQFIFFCLFVSHVHLIQHMLSDVLMVINICWTIIPFTHSAENLR